MTARPKDRGGPRTTISLSSATCASAASTFTIPASAASTQLTATDAQLAQVWNRPAEEIRRRMLAIKTNADFESFGRWLMHNGMTDAAKARYACSACSADDRGDE